jgi:hypothetical protein
MSRLRTAFLLASFTACGGRGPLLPGDLLAGAADDDDDTPPVSTGSAGNGSGGKPGPSSSAGAGGVGGASAGTLSAEAGQGGAVDDPLSDRDYYVDVSRGSDLNAGTEDAPFKTVEHALGVAIDGDTVWFEDGFWDWQNEPAFRDDRELVVADGVELRARHAGSAQLLDQAYEVGGFILAGDAKLFGLHFIGFDPALRADHGRIELDSVSFESPWDNGICHYGERALIMLSGTAQLTMRGDGESGPLRTSAKCLARLDDSAVLRFAGGQITSANWDYSPSEEAFISTFGESELFVSDVTVRGNTLPIIGAWDDSQVHVEGTGFQGGAMFADRAPPLIHVADRAELDVDSSWFDGADLQPCLVDVRTQGHEQPAAKVSLRNSSFSHCGVAVALQSGSQVQLDGVSISDNSIGIRMSGGQGDGSLEVLDSRIANNALQGIELDAGTGTLRFSMRGCNVQHNGVDGIKVGRRPALGGQLSLDLGTLERPGTNLLGGNGSSDVTGVSLRIADDVATTLFAVGNVWDVGQGSNGGGYEINDTNATVYDADHQLTGSNYAFVGEQSDAVTLRLAERTLP